jgi:ADP-heptose:LPS heptosyltransferase
VVVFRFPGDADVIRDFRSLTEAGVIAEWNGDRRFFGLLARCDVMLSPNTGPSHFALALDVPRVTLYGRDADLWSPPRPGVVALRNPRQACLNCGKDACPVNRSCILGITPDEVVTAVTALLRERDSRSGAAV